MAIMDTIIIYIYHIILLIIIKLNNNNYYYYYYNNNNNGIHIYIVYHNYYIIPYINIYIYTITYWKLHHAPYTWIYLGWWLDPLHDLHSPRRQSPPVRRRGWPWDGITDHHGLHFFSIEMFPPRWSNHMKCGIWKSHKGWAGHFIFFHLFSMVMDFPLLWLLCLITWDDRKNWGPQKSAGCTKSPEPSLFAARVAAVVGGNVGPSDRFFLKTPAPVCSHGP